MVKYLANKNIDREKWDKCIAESPNRLIYAFSWYLDIVAFKWDALVWNDYEAVMPLPYKSKLLFRHLYQPWLAQQLGIFGKISGIDLQVIEELLFRNFRYGHICFNSSNAEFIEKKNITHRRNLVLPLNKPYTKLMAGYSKNHLRNIGKAKKASADIHESLSIEDYLLLFRRSNQKQKVGWKKEHLVQLKQLIELGISGQHGGLVGIYYKEELLSATFYLNDNKRITWLLPVSSQKGYNSGAQFQLIDFIIKKHAGTEKLLDFEGSSIEGIARFYKGFGAKEETYFFYRYRNLL
jgi:hypothetical protein